MCLKNSSESDLVVSEKRVERMSLMFEIKVAFENAKAVKKDLGDLDCKSLCDRLSEICWEIINAPSLEGKIPELCYLEALESTASFSHLNSRIYEVWWLYKLTSEYLAGKFDPRGIKRLLVADSRLDFRPLRGNLFLQGLCEYFRDGMDAAQYYFLRANQEYISRGMVTPFFSYSRSICPPIEVFEESWDSVSGVSDEDGNLDCILVAANSGYVTRFLENYARSIRDQSNSVVFHLHWIKDGESESDETAMRVIEKVRQFLGEQFKTSEEACPNVSDKRSYYASCRFLIASALIGNYRRLMITDIDYEVVGDLHPFLQWCNKYDVSLQIYNNIKRVFPWMRVMAGTVVVKNSAMGRLFLEAYRRYFDIAYLPHALNWGVDQNILSGLLERFEKLGFIGNSRLTKNPFVVPYTLKRSGA
jgi:hypothetical protein